MKTFLEEYGETLIAVGSGIITFAILIACYPVFKNVCNAFLDSIMGVV